MNSNLLDQVYALIETLELIVGSDNEELDDISHDFNQACEILLDCKSRLLKINKPTNYSLSGSGTCTGTLKEPEAQGE